jgi:hypothetical protein
MILDFIPLCRLINKLIRKTKVNTKMIILKEDLLINMLSIWRESMWNWLNKWCNCPHLNMLTKLLNIYKVILKIYIE